MRRSVVTIATILFGIGHSYAQPSPSPRPLSPTPTSSTFCSDPVVKPDGYYPAAPCGNAFYQCVNTGQTTQFSCQGDTYFNPSINVCDFYYNIPACLVSPSPSPAVPSPSPAVPSPSPAIPSPSPAVPSPSPSSTLVVTKLRLTAATLTLSPVQTTGAQTAANGAVLNDAAGAVDATSSNSATASVIFNNLQRINTAPTGTPAANKVDGSLDLGSFTCPVGYFLGTLTAPFDVRLVNAPESSLKTECIAANNLLLQNNGGTCLQTFMSRAQRFTISGSRSVEVALDPQSPPRVIDVSGMTSWGAPGRGPLNTRVYINLSRLQSTGNSLVNGSILVQGTLPYVVPDGAYGVVIRGCGAKKVNCTVTDSNGRNVCRQTGICVATTAEARDAWLSLYNGAACSNTEIIP